MTEELVDPGLTPQPLLDPLVQLIVIIASARIGGCVARYFAQPRAVGEIVSGIAIGALLASGFMRDGRNRRATFLIATKRASTLRRTLKQRKSFRVELPVPLHIRRASRCGKSKNRRDRAAVAEANRRDPTTGQQ